MSAKRPVRGQQTGQPSSNHVHDRGSFDQSLLMCVALSYKKRVNVPFYSYDLCEKYKQYLPVRRGSTSTPQRSTLAAGKCHECNVDDRTLRQVSHSVYHSLVSSYNELNQLAVNIPWQSFRAASTSDSKTCQATTSTRVEKTTSRLPSLHTSRACLLGSKSWNSPLNSMWTAPLILSLLLMMG